MECTPTDLRSTSIGDRYARAQSESIGVILLTAVIVLLVGGFGVVYLGTLDGSGQGPLVDAEVNATTERVEITHGSGESVAIGELDVIVRVDGASERYSMAEENVRNGEDGRFDPGDRYRRNHGLGSGSLEVLLVHTASNDVLHHAYLDVGDGRDDGPSTAAAFSYRPTDPEPGQTLTFDASTSTGEGGIDTYALDWDGAVEYTATSRQGTITTTFTSIGRIEDTGGTPEYFEGRLEDL